MPLTAASGPCRAGICVTCDRPVRSASFTAPDTTDTGGRTVSVSPPPPPLSTDRPPTDRPTDRPRSLLGPDSVKGCAELPRTAALLAEDRPVTRRQRLSIEAATRIRAAAVVTAKVRSRRLTQRSAARPGRDRTGTCRPGRACMDGTGETAPAETAI